MYQSDLLPTISAYVNGQWLPPDAVAVSVAVTDPATGELLARLPQFGADTTTAAIAAAQTRLAEPPSLDQRGQWLRAIRDAHLEHQEELATIITRENGKPLSESRGEVAYAAGFYGYFAKHLDVLQPELLDTNARDCSWTIHRRPAGVVGLITPWNFPLAMLAKKLSAAIGAGCPSVSKPATLTPLAAIALMELIHRIGLPPGFVNLLHGDSTAIGKTLCEHPAVRLISFTGSTGVGQAISRQSADGVKRLDLELGGNAPYIVFADADLDQAADALIPNKFRANGQTCVCTNRVLVQEAAADAFTERVAARVRALAVGNGMDDGVDVGPLIHKKAWEGVHALVTDALEKGARRVTGEAPETPTADHGCYYPPTVLAGVRPGMQLCQDEIFGPVIPIATFATEAEAIALANDQPYGLAAYVCGADDAQLQRVAARLQFGHVALNTGAGPTPEAPFGGMKLSGHGREGGTDGLLAFSEEQTVAVAL